MVRLCSTTYVVRLCSTTYMVRLCSTTYMVRLCSTTYMVRLWYDYVVLLIYLLCIIKKDQYYLSGSG